MADVKKIPNPVDVHVGARLRLRRTSVGMSQEKLGEHLGITFQQIQKYEKGTNRIGASRLQNISEVLSVPVAFFFDGLDNPPATVNGMQEPPKEFVHDGYNSSETLQLTRAFARIADPKVRRRVLDLVRSLGSLEDEPENS
ncbi:MULTISPECIES: helix-turn-helix domain-containing protein [unclassified Aureimonas]|uniref:helix-turn-helix domain-containing protein n=1 Tax=unclassified Aureimonas TaxID=2615206 RepID=UPI0007223F72|nr:MULTISPECIES: helix-turn-helix domain-containing protein [unclassified Aureimonas]ALN71270.1 Cro/Cl family transcriptional regulator [Aureimonas sp. AU20]